MLRKTFILLVLLGAFVTAPSYGQLLSPSLSVNGGPLVTSQPVTRIGNQWFLPLVPVARALGVQLELAAGSSVLHARRLDGSELEYDARTGEIRHRHVLAGLISNSPQVRLPSILDDSFLFPLDGMITLLGVEVKEDQDANVLRIETSQEAASGDRLPRNPAFSLGEMIYRYGLTTNGKQQAQSLDLSGKALLRDVHLTGRILSSGDGSRSPMGVAQASLRADFSNKTALLLGDRNTYSAVDALNTPVRGIGYEQKIGSFKSSLFAGRGISATVGGIGISKPRYDTKVASFSLTRSTQAGSLSVGANAFRGSERNGTTVGLAFSSSTSARNQVKVQTAFGRFSDLRARTTREAVEGPATGISVSDVFTPFRQLTISGQFEHFGKNFLTAHDDSRLNGQTTQAVSLTLRPSTFLTISGGTSNRKYLVGEAGHARTYNYGVNGSLPGELPLQLGYFRSIQTDTSAVAGRFAIAQYLLGLPKLNRYSAFLNISEVSLPNERAITLHSVVNADYGRHRLGLHHELQLRASTRIGVDWSWETANNGCFRFGLDRWTSLQTRHSSLVPMAAIRIGLPGGKTLHVSYHADRNTRLLQFEIGGRLMNNRHEIRTDGERPTIVVSSPFAGRIYVDVDSSGSFDANIDKPLPGVVVRLDDSTTATTDRHGSYRFQNVQPGAHSVSSDLAGVPADMVFDGPSERRIAIIPYRTNTQDFRVVRTGRVLGKITYLDYAIDPEKPIERPLPDVRIIATERYDTFSEVDGAFLLGDLPPGQYMFRLDPATLPPSYVPIPATFQVDVKAGETQSGLLFQLRIPPKPVIERRLSSQRVDLN